MIVLPFILPPLPVLKKQPHSHPSKKAAVPSPAATATAMEAKTKYPFLPPNYVTISDLRERWLKRQQEKQKESIKDQPVEVQEQPKIHPEIHEIDLKPPGQSRQRQNTKSNPKSYFGISDFRYRNRTSRTLEGYGWSPAKVDMGKKVNDNVKFRGYQKEEAVIGAVVQDRGQKETDGPVIDAAVAVEGGVSKSQGKKSDEFKSKKKQMRSKKKKKAEEPVTGAVVAVGDEGIKSRYQKESEARVIEAVVSVEGGVSESQHKKLDKPKWKSKNRRRYKKWSEKTQNPKTEEEVSRETAKSAPEKEMPAIFSVVGEVRDKPAETGKVVGSGLQKITDQTADIGRRLVDLSVSGARDGRSGQRLTGMRKSWRRSRHYRGLQWREKDTRGKSVWVKKGEYSETVFF